MKVENDIQRISRLILKSISSGLSEGEREELDAWRSKASKHEEIYRKLTGRSFTASDEQRFRVAREANDWLMLQKKIMLRRKRSSVWKKWLPYAAVLMVGVLAVYLLKDSGERVMPKKTALAQQVILPGETRAILELENGEQIHLGESGTTDSVRLEKLGVMKEAGSIAYSRQDTIEVEEHVLRVPRGGEYMITLADGTKVWVNSESVLRYPSRFVKGERRVSVEGEAYFQVAKNKDAPFVVEAGGIDVRVTGTEFNVMAYQDKDRIETTLVKGSVEIHADDKVVNMHPRMQVVYSKESGQMTTRIVDTKLYSSWKDGVFEFKNLTLREIAGQLERWYDVEFEFREDSLADIRFTGAVKKSKPLSFILDIIKSTHAINFKVDEKNVIVERE